MSTPTRAECPVQIVEALEDMTIEIALLQQLVCDLAETTEMVVEPIAATAKVSH